MRIIIEGTDTTERSTEQTTPRVSVELPYDDLSIEDMLNYLVRPALLAVGYAEGSVNAVLGEV